MARVHIQKRNRNRTNPGSFDQFQKEVLSMLGLNQRRQPTTPSTHVVRLQRHRIKVAYGEPLEEVLIIGRKT